MKLEDVREQCEQSLYYYAQVMFPTRYFGEVHEEMFLFFEKSLRDAMEKGDGDNAAALIPRDHQKALTLDTKIATPSGWKYLKDIQVGDYVFGKDGLPKTVQALHPVVEQAVYEVELDDGRVLKASPEHLWEVTCPSNTKDKEVVKSTKDIEKNYISQRFDKRNGKHYNEYRYFVTAPKPVQYAEKDLEIDPYTLVPWIVTGKQLLYL